MAEPDDNEVDQVADVEDEVVDDRWDGDPDDDEDDDDVDLLEAENSAPWSPVPTAVARRWQQGNPDAVPSFDFPTVYEENRSKKIRDLLGAQTAGTISHRWAAEQIAAELGIENYDYEQEQENIAAERKAGLGQPELGAGDELAKALGLAGQGTPERQRDEPEPKRADLSGDAKAGFRRDMRQSEAAVVISPSLQVQPPDIIVLPAPAARPPAHRQVEYDAKGRAVRVIETAQDGQRHVLLVERDANGRLAGLRPAEAEAVRPMLTKEETNYATAASRTLAVGSAGTSLSPGPARS